MSILGKASKNYWVSRGNKDTHVQPAFAFAKKQIAEKSDVWFEQCLSFVRQALGAPGMGGTAVDAWNRNVHPTDRTHTFYNPPPGVPVFWSGGAGHVVLSGPDAGYCWSTDVRVKGEVSYVTIAEVDKWLGKSHRYLGWTDTCNGVVVVA
jgi:hypothetical protein